MSISRSDGDAEHREISPLIPWFVNSTLADNARQRVEAHLGRCTMCRDELLIEQRIFEGMGKTAIEYMPAVSFKRLQSKLDAQATESPAPDLRHVELASRKRAWPGLMAASMAIMAITTGLLAADRWMQIRAHGAEPNYRTVTNSAPRPRGEVIRIVFSPTTTLVEMQGILEESQLRIISGPTEAGVYSLAAESDRPLSSSLALLRRHSTVRFAERTGPESQPGDSP
jgi:hypothetical protein